LVTEGVPVSEGSATTVTKKLAVSAQPEALAPITVYVVVAVGETVTALVVAALFHV
jgi:hypothetical protein